MFSANDDVFCLPQSGSRKTIHGESFKEDVYAKFRDDPNL